MRPTIVYDTYWKFAFARQEIFFKRLAGQPAPWTDDYILDQYRFTNVYRAADRVSQYVIGKVIPEGSQEPEEVFLRVVLFKLFNRIETWQRITAAVGCITASDFPLREIDRTLTRALTSGHRIYSAAYIIPPAPGTQGRKHRGHLRLVAALLADRVCDRLRAAPTMARAFAILRALPMFGDFLAYQLLVDLNYSNMLEFSEMDHVVPGPGAVRGIAKCFVGYRVGSEADIIRMVADRQEQEFQARGLVFRTLWGRRLQLVDCQNIFCEVDKYSRLAHPEVRLKDEKSRIKQRFRPSGATGQLLFPQKWGLKASHTEGYALV